MAIVMQDIISRVEEYLMDFNALSKRPMNLAVFALARLVTPLLCCT